MFNVSHFYQEQIRKQRSSYKFVLHDGIDDESDYYYRRALNLMKREVVHETFGLSLADVLEMDYASFVMLEKAVDDVVTEKSKIADGLTKDNKLPKPPKG